MPERDVHDQLATLQTRLDELERRRDRRRQREFFHRYVALVLPAAVGALIGAGAQVLALHLALDQGQDPTSWLTATVYVCLFFTLVFAALAWLIRWHHAQESEEPPR